MTPPKLSGPKWTDETNEGEGIVHRRPDTFGKLFASIIHDTEISDGAARLYAHMHWRYGSNHRMFESIETMAAALNVSERTIKLRINELAAAGWIVVMARRIDGKVDSNFYHVFELPADADKFRREYKAVEGEYIRPMPSREIRKSRKGVGGKPAHKPATEGTQVPMAVGTQVPMVSAGTQVPPAVGTQVPTIKIQTQSIQTQKIAASAVASAEPPISDLTPEQLFDELAERNNRRITTNSVAKVLAQPDSKPAKPARANPHFDAIITAFHFDAATMTKTEKGGIGKVAAELNAAGYTPEDIAEIHAYCVRKGFDAFTPHALTAHASAWRASVNGKGAAKSGSMFGEGNWNLHAWDDIDAVGGAK